MKALSLSLIPAALAVGACYWLFFARNVHEFKRALKQEERAAVAVGAYPPPQEPIKIELKGKRSSCIVIESASIDGESLTGVLRNACSVPVAFVKVQYRTFSSAGVMLRSYSYWVTGREELPAKTRAEFNMQIDADRRIERLEVSGSWYEDRH